MAQVPFPAPGAGGDVPPLPGAAARDGQPPRDGTPREGTPGDGTPRDGTPQDSPQPKAGPAGDGQPQDGTPPDDPPRDDPQAAAPRDDPQAATPPPAAQPGDGVAGEGASTAPGADAVVDDADGFDADADLARLLDDIEAGLIPIPPEDDPGAAGDVRPG